MLICRAYIRVNAYLLKLQYYIYVQRTERRYPFD